MAQIRRPKGSGSIRKLGPRKYQAQYTAPPGSTPPRPSRIFDRQADAQAWLAEQLDAIRTGRYVSRSDQTLAEWISQFIATFRSKAQPATQDEYAYSIKRLAKHCPGLLQTPLQDISVPALQDMVNTLQAAYHSRTVEITYKLVRQALRKAAALHMMPPLELGEVDIKQDPPKRGGRYIPAPLLRKLQDYCRNPVIRGPQGAYLDALLVISLTGARSQEILALRDTSVNRQTLSITHALNNRGQLGPTKTRQSVRDIPMVPEVQFICERRRRDTLSGLLFESRTGKPLQHRNLTRAMQRILPGYAPHDLRHTYATNAVRRGVNIKDLSRLTGDSVQQILTTYVHPDEDHLMMTARKIVSDKVVQIKQISADKQIISKLNKIRLLS